MSEQVNLNAESREVEGKSSSRQLRRAGSVPAVFYGGMGTITVDGAPYTSGSTPGPYASGGRVVHEWSFASGGVLSQATMEGGPNGRTYASGIAVNGYLLIDGQTATPTNGIGGV